MVFLVAVLLVSISAPVYAAQGSELNFGQITTELSQLGNYIRDIDINGVRQQEFNEEVALRDGFSKETIAIAKDMIMYQNDISLIVANEEVTDITKISVILDKYPSMQAFFVQASQQLKDKETNESLETLEAVDPCGDWDHPVPDYTPSRTTYSGLSDGRQWLITQGFHATAGYACGGDPFVPCEHDFTRGRSYNGPYGTCSTPRFRDQGSTDSNDLHIARIQYGEPNPEVLSYSWLYWNWGAYVLWWHDNF
jgi:hypothetical protein